MSLPALQLDDIRWQQMVEAVRGRIVAHSRGKWTMHGAVDPGVILLELFAYLLEQRIYWMDQVPEQTMRAILALLDDAPIPTRAGQTLLSIAPLQSAATPGTVEPGTVFHTQRLDEPEPLTVRERLTVLPITQIESSAIPHKFDVSVLAGGVDRTSDLRSLQAVPLLPFGGGVGQWQLTLWMTRKLDAAEYGGACNILLDIETPNAVEPDWALVPTDLQWSTKIGDGGFNTSVQDNEIVNNCGLTLFKLQQSMAPREVDEALGEISTQWALDDVVVRPPATLRWSYSTVAGTRQELSSDQYSDGTAGLRRAGVFRMQIPPDWQPIDTPVAGPFPYRIWVDCEHCTFSSPPTLRRVIPNVVLGQNLKCVKVPWTTLSETVMNWLRMPGQTIVLPQDQPPPLENRVRLFLRETDGDWHRWQPTDHFYRHGPEDRVFRVDRVRREIIFGNGLTGRIPVLASGGATVRLCYLAGGGTDGNIEEQIWRSDAIDNPVLSVVTPKGAANAESADEVRARVARDLQRVERAVVNDDYVQLATTTPGVAVARAFAAVGAHPDFPCQSVAGAVTVYIVPEVPRPENPGEDDIEVMAPISDPGEVDAVHARLEARRLIGQEIFVQPVRYRAVGITIHLEGIVLDEENLKRSIQRQLSAFLDPLIGGFEKTGWPFGEPLRPSALMQQIRDLLIDGVALTGVGISLDGSDVESCHETEIEGHNLVYLADVDIRINRRTAARGGLL